MGPQRFIRVVNLSTWPLTGVFSGSEKGDLEAVAVVKIKQLTAELEATDANKFDPVEKIQTGFAHFKNEIYEYVSCTL